jgi:hypothetical protein
VRGYGLPDVRGYLIWTSFEPICSELLILQREFGKGANIGVGGFCVRRYTLFWVR